MKTILNLGIIGAGGYLVYKNIVTLSKTSNKKDMIIPALVVLVSAVAIYHSIPQATGGYRMAKTPSTTPSTTPTAVINISEQPTEDLETQG
jgi:hypothetical protein